MRFYMIADIPAHIAIWLGVRCRLSDSRERKFCHLGLGRL